jgi:hypothetical protein
LARVNHWLIYRIGRRGSALLFFGFLDLVYAYSLIAPTGEARRTPTFVFIAHTAPLWAWAALWGAVGVICLVQAFMVRDRVAFTAAMFVKVLFGVTTLFGWLTGAIERGYVAAAVWLALALLVYLLSTWPEPRVVARPQPPRGGERG